MTGRQAVATRRGRPRAITTLVKEFGRLFTTGMQQIIEAAHVYVDAIDAHGEEAKEAMKDAFPQVQDATWRRIEAVGRQELHSRLMFASFPAERYMRRLGFEDQEKCFQNGISIFIKGTVDEDTALIVAPDKLTPFQCRQVFGDSHVRDLSEQRAYLESLTTKRNIREALPVTGYKVRGKTLLVGNVKISRRELLHILEQMG